MTKEDWTKMNEESHYRALQKQDKANRQLIKKLQLERDALKKQLRISDVSQKRELLLAYEQSKCPKTWWMSKSQAECEVDDFLANNCG